MNQPNEVVRRYAKYIFIDVVGFSKRSAEAQSDIVRAFNEIVHTVLEHFEIRSDNDRILIPTGDGMCIALIASDLVFDIHICIALEILHALQRHNRATKDPNRKFEVRIGINQNTDILVTDINNRCNVAGAGINMASRVMDKADGSQILVSEAVHFELQPSEHYTNTFQGFSATGKHGIKFRVYQYVTENIPGLDVNIPSAFQPPKSEVRTLPEETAYYMAEAILHKADISRLRGAGQASIVLLGFLAWDRYKSKNTPDYISGTGFITKGYGTLSFDEQFAYYNTQNFYVRFMAQRGLIQLSDFFGLQLSAFEKCFEFHDELRHFEFVNEKGKQKLRDEWPSIWAEYDLDNI
jgi:class 3 adenylate cyclase